MTTTERPARASVMAAAAPAGPPPRTMTSHSGQVRRALIFGKLNFIRNCLCHDKSELRPVLDHVYVLLPIGRPHSMGILTAPHLVRTLAGPPVRAIGAIAIVEVGLPR